MWIIEKSAGSAINFVEVFVNGPIGHEHEFAEQLAKDITTAMNLVELLKTNPSLRLINASYIQSKLFWADDTHQWEVYSIENRATVFHYKGDSLRDAIAALWLTNE